MFNDARRVFPNKGFLTIEDVALLLECEPQVIRNWTKRADPTKRPPRVRIGKQIRFPLEQFCQWLEVHQFRSSEARR
jgi:hypothetical protein